jgi:hypothetical protein
MSDEHGGPAGEHGGPAPEHGGPAPEADDEPQPRAAHRVIVKLNRDRFAADADLEREAASLAADIPGAEVERVSHTGRVLLNLSGDLDPVSLAAELSTREGVDYAEPDVIDRAQDPTD